jgi:hypothetical protein
LFDVIQFSHFSEEIINMKMNCIGSLTALCGVATLAFLPVAVGGQTDGSAVDVATTQLAPSQADRPSLVGKPVQGSIALPGSSTSGTLAGGCFLFETGFEAPVFATGPVAGQAGWVANTPDGSPIVSNNNPLDGDQHLRLTEVPGVAPGTLLGGFTPTCAPGGSELQADVFISAIDGANYILIPGVGTATGLDIVTQMIFNFDGNVVVVDNEGAGAVGVNTGVAWPVGEYFTARIAVVGTQIEYYINDDLIYTGNLPFPAANTITRAVVAHDNFHLGENGDVDNLTFGEGIGGPSFGACCTGDGPADCTEGVTLDECQDLNGTWLGSGTTCALCPQPVECPIADAPVCVGDLNNDNVVNVFDLLILLGDWGPCPGCPADLTGDGVVNVFDLLELLGNWGPCPTPEADADGEQGFIGDECGVSSNLGCSDDSEEFGNITCGDTICGTIFTAGGGSDCCVDNGTPGCDDAACEAAVCDCDPFCCDSAWDAFCAGPNDEVPGCSADELCSNLCEDFEPETRDLDWYQIEITEDTRLNLNLHAEFPATLILVRLNDGCDDTVAQAATVLPNVATDVDFCVSPGSYAVVVTTNGLFGQDLTCDANANNYTLSLRCSDDCEVVGACCTGEECSNQSPADCAAAGSDYLGSFFEGGQVCEDIDSCPLVQQECPLSDTDEGLGCGNGLINGGCNAEPPSFSTVCCNQPVTGNVSFDPVEGIRDLDWYVLEVEEDGAVAITLEGNFPPGGGLLLLADGNDCDDIPIIAAGAEIDGEYRIIANLTAGLYTVIASVQFPDDPTDASLSCDVGGVDYTLTVNCSDEDAVGFSCATAVPVEIDGGSATINTAGLLPLSQNLTQICGQGADADPNDEVVWFSFVGDGTLVDISTCDSSGFGSTRLWVFCSSCDNLGCVTDVFGGGNQSSDPDLCGPGPDFAATSICTEQGQVYFVAVTPRNSPGAVGDITLEVTTSPDWFPGAQCSFFDFPSTCDIPEPTEGCGVAGTGDCCQANGSPFCDDEACCEAVCAGYPFCCDTEWDAFCAGEGFDDDCLLGPGQCGALNTPECDC